jgi:alpha-N-acetylglucosaminidase
MIVSLFRIFWLTLLAQNVGATPPPLLGETSAVHDLINRVLEGKDHPFRLKLLPPVSSALHFKLQDGKDDKIEITASTASELSAGVGWYLRHYCNMTLGWPSGGGSRIIVPDPWPKIGSNPVVKKRAVPWSYFMNVCTHSYSLVWYNEQDWEAFIDWLSLTGINMILALTGQEQVFYETFRHFGVEDLDIRSWFNGPAFLTWSRGQNEYGNNICGPLPKSWMEDQYGLQKNFILPRLRSLGIVGQLPGFQGNVPIQMKELFHNKNMTQQGATGWMNSLDPLFGKIADVYMQKLLDSFGTDHWYQLDGYFDGGTAPWMAKSLTESYDYVDQESLPLYHDESWFLRGAAAYQGLNRTDPQAMWSYQGFSFIGWHRPEQAEALKGFIDAVPKDHFVIIDMSYTGLGEWAKFNNASFFGAPFVWTALHNFGGTDGIKGDIRRLNHFPFEILPTTSIAGIGGTPEGINQNPAYYEFLFESTFRDGPVENVDDYLVHRSLKRYGLIPSDDDGPTSSIINHLADTWTLLMQSLYSNDFSTQDPSGIGHLKPWTSGLFEDDRHTPKPMMCQVFRAWEHMILAIQEASTASVDVHKTLKENNEPFRYDLINLGREILAQLSTPAALNFTDATNQTDQNVLISSAEFYVNLLKDADTLVGTDQAFLLGPWLQSARKWGANQSDDCYSAILESSDCAHFYEWNARTQITTWNPTSKHSPSIPGGPIDYAVKHWSGLIKDYYVRRANILLGRALKDQAAGQPLNQTAVDRLFAAHAYAWTTSTNPYPQTVAEDAFEISIAMYEKYKGLFSSCSAKRGASKEARASATE